jgi:hypothetical protein
VFLIITILLPIGIPQSYGMQNTESDQATSCEVIDWISAINNIENLISQDLGTYHLHRLIYKIKKIRGRNTIREKRAKAEAETIRLESFRILNTLLSHKVFRESCIEQPSDCEKIITTPVFNRSSEITVELYEMTKDLTPVMRRVIKKSTLKAKNRKRHLKRLRCTLNSAHNLKDEILNSINLLPTDIFACDN